MFSKDQDALLSAPLSSSNVKKREGKYSYIEGWHAIAEANRIFGFGNWSRETVELRCVSEREREIGQYKTPGWGVTYVSRVRVTAWGEDGNPIVREGAGSGHGIDKDLGQAHESALKEAETDAMKRALMTFGNPFGLALYDKEQAGVETAAPAPKSAPPVARITGETKTASTAPVQSDKAAKAEAWVARQMEAIATFKTPKELSDWENKSQATIVDVAKSNPESHRKLLDYVMAQYDALNPVAA